MKIRTTRLARLLVAGASVAIAALFWADGPPSTFAQTDTTAPTISSIAITSDPDENDADLGAYNLGGPGRVSESTNWASGVYRIGDEVQVTVTFSENVTVTGPPQLELATDPRNRTAAYESAEGSGVVFSYTVAQGDWDNNGIAISANKLTLNGGSIKDAANNDADLSHNALAAQDGHKVDGVRPTLSRLYFVGNSDGSNGAYTTGGELTIIAKFTERNGPIRGSVSGPPQVKLDLGGEEKAASWDYSLRFNDKRTDVAYFSYVVQEGNLDSDGPAISTDSVELNGGFIRDAAGNDAVLTHSAVTSGTDFIVDAVAPTVSSIAITSDPGDDDTYGTGDKIEVTVTFSENMSLPTTISCSSDVVHCKAELELNIGGTARTADYQSHDGAEVVYAYTVQAGDNDDNGIAIGANRLTGQRIMDAAGKNGEGINDADLSHDAVADDSEHKVVTSGPTKSTDATLSALTLSGIDIGTFTSGTTSYTADVANSVTETTVTPTVNHSGATYVIELNGVTDADGVVSLSVGSNVITLEVTAEDDSTTKTYTVTVTRAAATISAPDLTVPSLLTFTNPWGYSPSFSLSANVVNQGSGSSGTTTLRYYRSTDSTITRGDTEVGTDAVGGLAASGRRSESIDLTAPSAPGTYYYGACVDAVSDESDTTNNCSGSIAFIVPAETSTDATLSGLSLSDVNFGTFASGTTAYSAQVANSVTETTVTPTVNDSGATYVIKLGGVTDADGVVSLSVGSNVITIEVNAEDDDTTKTYTVTVTRAAPPSTDATLSALTLSGIDFGTFASGTTSYSAQVANSVSQTTVTPTVNDSGASYLIKLGGVEDADGVISLSVGSNVITIEVTAEDDDTTETYTATVTRASPSTDATLSELTLSDVDFGTFASGTTSYSAQVANSVSRTTVKPTVNDSEASYAIKLGGVTDADGVVSLSVGSNVITVEVTAEDDNTTRTYTVTVARAEPPSTDATLSELTLSGIEFGTFDSTTASYSAQVANSVSQTTVTPTLNDLGASYVIKLGGVKDADGVVSLSVGSNVITVEVTAEDDEATRTYTVTVTRAEPPSTDATLSELTLSGIEFGTFDPTATAYSAQVANSVSQTTVAPTVNDPEASYVIKLGAVTDADGEVLLNVGSNVITVEVTAEDDNTTQTYTVTVTRAEPLAPELSSDATLSALTLSGIDFGVFDSTTTSYSAQIANSVSETTVTPTLNHSGASYVIRLSGVTAADGVIALSVGSNALTVEVTAEDGDTTQTYTVTIARVAPPSTDATLRALTLSGIDFGTFASGTASYSAQVANSVSQTTVTPTVTDSEASYVIKLGGATDADSVVSLSVGSNVITVEVTAGDGETTRTYTVTVARAEPSSTDATLSTLSLSNVDFGTFDSTTTSYTGQVANGVTETTVTPTANQSGASYVVMLEGVEDEDGEISLAVGSNLITIEVTAEDDSTTQTYSVTVTRAPESRNPYDANADGTIDGDEAIAAVIDYFDGYITSDEVIEVIILYFSSFT